MVQYTKDMKQQCEIMDNVDKNHYFQGNFVPVNYSKYLGRNNTTKVTALIMNSEMNMRM